MSKHIAFIGLGNMGAPMAANLLKADYRVSVFDLQLENIAKLVAQGARAAHSSLEAVREAEVVISMLPSGQHVRELYLGANGVLAQLREECLIIDCSTIAASDAQAVAQAAQTRGLAMLDAPVSGGTAGAQAGSLSFMVGGEEQALARAQPILAAMGSNIFHAGRAGAGQIAKACNNMLLGILMAGTAEALNLGVSHGLSPQVLSEIMCKSSGRNWALEQYNPWPDVMPSSPASRGYSGGFASQLMLKDLGLAQELASQQATPLGALVRQMYQLHVQGGNGGLDFSSIVRLLAGE